jgi:hypothetical protein
VLIRALWPCAALTVVLALTVLAGCAGSGATRPPDTTVPITSIELIKGKWAGVVERAPRREDYIEVMIHDDATYQVTSARTAGEFEGKGKLTLRDGQAFAESQRAKSTYRLIDRGGKRVLRLDVVETNGLRYGTDLTR